MKLVISNLTAVLVAALCASTVAAAPTAAEQEAQQRARALQQLSVKNSQRVAQLRRAVEATWNWHVAKKAKDFGAINSNITEMVTLVTLKEGAAKGTTLGDVFALKARAYADPINLRFYAEAKRAYEEALKAQEDADRKARVAHAFAKYLFACGQEPAEKCEKAMLDAYNTPGIAAATKMALLRDGVPGLGFVAEGRKVAEESGDLGLLREWYLFATAEPGWQDRDKFDPLEPANCTDYRLAMCDEALARIEPKWHAEFLSRKGQLLRKMGRWADAENLVLAQLAAITNVTDRRRVPLLGELAALTAERAARYYQKPDETLARKAIWYWEEALRIDPANGGLLRKIVEQSMYIGDWDLATRNLDALTVTMKDGKPDAWICAVRGDIAYYRGDYEQAVKWYQTFEKFPDGPAVVKIPNSHQRFAGALYATGRYEECLKALDGCPNYWSFKDTNANYRKILQAKIAEKTDAKR